MTTFKKHYLLAEMALKIDPDNYINTGKMGKFSVGDTALFFVRDLNANKKHVARSGKTCQVLGRTARVSEGSSQKFHVRFQDGEEFYITGESLCALSDFAQCEPVEGWARNDEEWHQASMIGTLKQKGAKERVVVSFPGRGVLTLPALVKRWGYEGGGTFLKKTDLPPYHKDDIVSWLDEGYNFQCFGKVVGTGVDIYNMAFVIVHITKADPRRSFGPNVIGKTNALQPKNLKHYPGGEENPELFGDML